MAKITDDPKVQELVAKIEAKHGVVLDKAIANVRKATIKEAVEIIKTSIEANKDIEDKNTKKLVASILRDILANVKGL